MSPLERKQKIYRNIKTNMVPYMEALPVIEDVNEIQMRSAEEIAKTSYCLFDFYSGSM